MDLVEIRIETTYQKGEWENTQGEFAGFRTVIVNPMSSCEDYVLPQKDIKEFAIKQAVHIKRVTKSPAMITFDGVLVERSEYI